MAKGQQGKEPLPKDWWKNLVDICRAKWKEVDRYGVEKPLDISKVTKISPRSFVTAKSTGKMTEQLFLRLTRVLGYASQRELLLALGQSNPDAAPFVSNHINYNEQIKMDLDDPAARLVVDRFDIGRYFSIGPSIVVRQFGQIFPGGAKLNSIGIPTNAVVLQRPAVAFRRFDPELIDQSIHARIATSGKANLEKYSLVGLDPQYNILDEGHRIALRLESTDFQTIMACLGRIGNVEDVSGRLLTDRAVTRALHGNPEPQSNRVPNSLCLHYMLRFADDRYLSIHRHGGVAYDKLRISVSGEEQLQNSDFRQDFDSDTMGRWAHRAVLEEVFPGRGHDVDNPEVQSLRERIDWVRCLSLIYEERFCNFAVVALVQLNCAVEEYVEIYRKSLRYAANFADYEGNRYWFGEKDIGDFFHSGRLRLRPFVASGAEIFAVSNTALESDSSSRVFGLHSSSLYRLQLAGRLSGQL